MIQQWSIENFKSVGTQIELDFRPLTIFSGPNNSGKSTIIQSLLLTAQTIQSQVSARPVVLNAQMVRLGDYSDIVHGGDLDADVSIGFVLELPTRHRHFRRGTPRQWLSPYYMPGIQSGTTTTIEFRYSFGSYESPKTGRLVSQLESLKMRVHNIDAEEESDRLGSISATRALHSPEERLAEYSIVGDQQDQQEVESLLFEVENLFPREIERQRKRLADRKYVGLSLRHFLPRSVSAVYDKVATEVKNITKALIAPSGYEWDSNEKRIDEIVGRQPLQTVLIECAESVLESQVAQASSDEEQVPARYVRTMLNRLEDATEQLRQEFTAGNWEHLHRILPPSVRGLLAEKLEKRRDEIAEAIRGGRNAEYRLTFLGLPDLLRAGSFALERHLETFFYYLGPLRDEPKSIYPLQGATDPNDVGLKGEHTAAVLDLNRQTEIEYLPPDAISRFPRDENPKVATLVQAVTKWLDYMGVGSDVDTVDQGKLGHELKVETAASNAFHDLTQVGVGVSQVLPILVSSLLATPGSILIFEQPELHLHPRVQARLADFFLSMTRLGKQCIVETHSEYLINRLRFHIANAEDVQIFDTIRIYFAEKEGPESVYHPISINRYGKIEDWPQGFFDEGERIAASILKAGYSKRRQSEDD